MNKYWAKRFYKEYIDDLNRVHGFNFPQDVRAQSVDLYFTMREPNSRKYHDIRNQAMKKFIIIRQKRQLASKIENQIEQMVVEKQSARVKKI